MSPPLALIVGVPVGVSNVTLASGPVLPTIVENKLTEFPAPLKLSVPRVVSWLNAMPRVFAVVAMFATAPDELGTPPEDQFAGFPQYAGATAGHVHRGPP